MLSGTCTRQLEDVGWSAAGWDRPPRQQPATLGATHANPLAHSRQYNGVLLYYTFVDTNTPSAIPQWTQRIMRFGRPSSGALPPHSRGSAPPPPPPHTHTLKRAITSACRRVLAAHQKPAFRTASPKLDQNKWYAALNSTTYGRPAAGVRIRGRHDCARCVGTPGRCPPCRPRAAAHPAARLRRARSRPPGHQHQGWVVSPMLRCTSPKPHHDLKPFLEPSRPRRRHWARQYKP